MTSAPPNGGGGRRMRSTRGLRAGSGLAATPLNLAAVAPASTRALRPSRLIPMEFSAHRLVRKVLDASIDRVVASVRVECPQVHHGSYGGWVVNPELIRADSVVYSFGLGEDVSFDLALIETYGVEVHGFEPDPRSLEWLAAQTFPASLPRSRARTRRS
jgi:hypothetical protein